ncbi:MULTISPECIES: aldo/keto reductase [Mumia]|uniref:aldo/keto reductase n=1 Tax=Mumia TaxID=1546255 RepID=UPI001422EA02|nr:MULTISPECIES: aldo/keto reductase [unclassified Mumia]QMW66621.1 aldo/keto reductase [Mumia sp. ZJ1417]
MTETRISADSAGAWQLGDLTVNRLGFGAMRLTGSAAFDLGVASDRDRSVEVLRRALDLGVNHIDTAAFYFSPLRSANELINSALAPYPDDLVIATKVGPGRDVSGAWLPPARPDQLRGQVEENLRQLGRDHLDLVNFRRMPTLKSISEHVGALAELRDAGLVRHIGISAVERTHLDEARAVTPVVCVQNRFAIGASDEAHDLLSTCGEHGIAFVPFFAVAGGGAERGRSASTEDDETLTIAAAHGASPAQVRLAWTLQQGAHVLAIPGTSNPDHLTENVAAAGLRLTADELTRLSSRQ